MIPRLFVFEDDDFEHFFPLTQSRPVFLLLSGASPIWRKLQRLFPEAEITFLCRAELSLYVRELTDITCNRFDFENCRKAIFINGRVLPNQHLVEQIKQADKSSLFLANGNLAAAVLEPISMEAHNLARMNYWGYGHFKQLIRELPKIETQVLWLNYIWDLLSHNEEELQNDWQYLLASRGGYVKPAADLLAEGCRIYQPENVHVAHSAQIAAPVVLDAKAGPIIFDERVYIAPFSFIEGPAYIGPGTQILGAKVRRGCSLGPECRIGGEIEASIFQGYSNKYHEGFIGHACLGEWINLGALTTNSDLKNNYGKIRVNLGWGEIDTGLVKIGSFIGDHVKTGIGMLLNTGISIGFASNIFGGGLVADKYIPPFVWGGPMGLADYDLQKALKTAEAAMPRRGKAITPGLQKVFEYIYNSSAEMRQRCNISP